MSTKLHVSNISDNMDEQGLKQMFDSYGSVTEATINRDRESGRSRGFEFVTFAKAEDATSAAEALNGVE